jgi:hypothetical protein
MSSANPFSNSDAVAIDGAAVSPPCKSARTDFAVIRISGEDATDFLHGQFSADLRAFAAGSTLVTAWCSPKGRVLFMPRLLRGADAALFVMLPATQGAAFIKRLRMFVLRAKVLIEDLTTSHGVMVLDGVVAATSNADVITGIDGERRWLLGPRVVLAQIWDALGVPAQDANAACLTDIARGDALLDDTLSDEFLPQELNLDLHTGVSFNKGCYPGQEIVARIKFRGTVKRRLHRLSITAPAASAPGTRLFGQDNAHRGTVLSCATEATGHYQALAVVDNDSGPLHLADVADSAIDSLPLPYSATGA